MVFGWLGGLCTHFWCQSARSSWGPCCMLQRSCQCQQLSLGTLQRMPQARHVLLVSHRYMQAGRGLHADTLTMQQHQMDRSYSLGPEQVNIPSRRCREPCQGSPAWQPDPGPLSAQQLTPLSTAPPAPEWQASWGHANELGADGHAECGTRSHLERLGHHSVWLPGKKMHRNVRFALYAGLSVGCSCSSTKRRSDMLELFM